jgi:hypothetical protein
MTTEPEAEGQPQPGRSGRGCLKAILWIIALCSAFAFVCIAGAGLMESAFGFDDVVQQAHADLAPGRMSGTVYITQCSPVVKDVGRGQREAFYRCVGEFFPESNAPQIPNVALISDLRRIPVTATVDALVVPGDGRGYRPWPLGFLYTLSLIATPLFVASLAVWLCTKRHRLAYYGLGVAMLLGLAAEVAEQSWVGW